MSRTLVCGECLARVQVFEAAVGARTLEEHQFLDPASFVCGGCLTRSGSVAAGALSEAAEAVGRARTAQERALRHEGVS